MLPFKTSLSDPSNFDRPDLVLIQTPGWGTANPPLALAVLSSFIRSQGLKVLPLDLNIEHYHARTEQYKNVWSIDTSQSFWNNEGMVKTYIANNLKMIQVHVKDIVKARPRVVGFSVYNSCIQVSFCYAQMIRELDPNIKIIFGGPHASRNMAGDWAISKPFVDACIQGEGENILLELLQRTRRGDPWDDCKGILTLKNGNRVDTGDIDLISDLNALPYADFTDFDFQLYSDPITLPIMSSRGCPNKCIYCTERAYWRTYRGYDPERIVDEIEVQLRRYPFLKRVEFQDSLVNGHIKRLESFADQIVERKLHFRWAGQAVIRKEMTFPLFEKLKKSGCEALAYGLETSSPELMISVGKLLAKETEIDRLVEDAHKAGLSCCYNFMFGMPGETEEDAKASLIFLKKHHKHVGAVNPSAAFCGFTRGTPGYDTPEKFGIVPSPEEGQFWESDNGTNNLLVRLRRFEAFCELAMDLGVRTTYPHRKLLERDRLIGFYQYVKKNYIEALPYLSRWVESHPDDAEIVSKLEECYAKTNTKPRPKVLLCHLPQWCVDQPPLGIAYLSGYLSDKGYHVRLRDLSVELFAALPQKHKYLLDTLHHEAWLSDQRFFEEVFPKIGLYLKKWILELIEAPEKILGFTILSTNVISTQFVIDAVKKRAPDKVIIVGGPHVTRYEGGPTVARHPSIDYVVPDEGEETFFELLETLNQGVDPKQVKGLLFMRHGELVDTGQRPLIQKISELPVPRFDKLDLKFYRWLTIPVLGSRGCIYSCAFCSETVLWRRYRYRTGQSLFEEMKHHSQTLGTRCFYIVDSLINGNIKELEKMCDLIIESGIQIDWSGKASIRHQMTGPLLKKMAKAGCRNIDYGLESGSPKVVKDMKKGFDLPLAKRVLKDSHEAGIGVGVFMLVGFPTESDKDYQMSKDFLKENQKYLHHVTPGHGCGIQAGSDLQVNSEKYGIEFRDGDWYSEHTTPEIRQFRVKDFREFCHTLDIIVT